ncbi:helix-turn-helix domain-containing protein [Amycolatopsis sp. NPDC006125]|uniref:helix-turn-helix domain-containing protein n=1 Tax=Amycolatopsis sp. NPDC006125 TaxID=3156730 RepID=UPI0033A23778
MGEARPGQPHRPRARLLHRRADQPRRTQGGGVSSGNAGTHPTGGAGSGPGRVADDEQTWWTPAEAASYARCSRNRVHLALESGELHGHQARKGGRWRIKREAVDAWIQGLDESQAAALCGCIQLRPVRRAA